jgi:hypothetical protein
MAKKPKSADKNNLKTAGPKKTPKPVKAAKAPKAEKAPKPPKEPKAPRSLLANEEDKALFLHHLPKIKAQKDKLATAMADLRNLYKTAKADGFEKADFDVAAALETAEKEAKTKAKIARQLQIAQFLDADLGQQLDMFLEPSRIPAVDRAYKEGQNAAMQHLAAKPGYDPSTEQHREYMRGYHEVQTKQLKAGIGKTAAAEPEPKPAPPKQAEKPTSAEAGAPITSGLRMSRADFALQQELAKEEAERSGAGPDSAFQRKAAAPS